MEVAENGESVPEPQKEETAEERQRREAEEKIAAIEAKRAEYMDPEKNDRYMRELFSKWPNQRTEIKGIPPARERIKQYKTKTIKRNVPVSAQSFQQKKQGTQSQSDLKGIKEVGASRPTTAGMVSTFGHSQAPTAATISGQASSALGGARAVSLSRFSRFEENEKSVQSQNFKAFYTSGEPTTYHKENRFEGRSNYQYYYPTGETYEQELEKFWWDSKNKELADKRRDEEAKLIMKEWGQARGRMESEIARKKEHLNVATNFGEARGWTRTCWKSKNHNHETETLDEFLNASESDDAEGEDIVKNMDLSDAESPQKYVAFGVNRSLRASATLGSRAKIVDFAADSQSYGLRPTTATMVKQLEAIDAYNKALPPKKRAKPENILPDIPAPNVHHFWGQVRNPKNGDVDLVRKFGNVGLIDSAEASNPEMPLGSVKAFSIANQARELQVRASQNKIRNLRKHYGGLIGTIDSKMDKADNPFQGSMPAKDSKMSSSEMSLSVYNRPSSLARPKTAKVNLLEGLPMSTAEKLEVQEVDENGVPIEKPPVTIDERFPDAFDIPKDFVKKNKVPPKLLFEKDPTMLTRSGTEQARLETMVEMQMIQDKLSKDNCPSIPMKALERAVMVCSEVEWTPNPADPNDRKYPIPGSDLMENPFPKPKKKKKGKKKKK